MDRLSLGPDTSQHGSRHAFAALQHAVMPVRPQSVGIGALPRAFIASERREAERAATDCAAAERKSAERVSAEKLAAEERLVTEQLLMDRVCVCVTVCVWG